MESVNKSQGLSGDKTPEALVAGQLNAYNARDIDAFMAYWHIDAEIYQHPDTLLAKGYGDIRARHVVRFLEPDLQAKLINRVVMGNRVVDIEQVTRNFPNGKGEVDVVGIYEIHEARIRKAWFLMGEPRMAV